MARVASRAAALLVPLLLSASGCAVLFHELNIAYLGVATEFSPADVRIEIRRSFLVRLMNRVTMRVGFRVEQSHAAPNPAFFDGDLHFAGRSRQVRLPAVGEIINAADEKAAVDLVHEANRTGRRVALSGAWRIWPEHAGAVVEKQGEDAPVRSANPDHVFEIHPVTAIAGLSLLDSFRPVAGYLPGAASVVVPSLEHVSCRIAVKPGEVVITTQKGLFNDLTFVMQITGETQSVVADGRFVTASLLDTDGKVLARDHRMVFVKDTAPELAVRGLRRGARLRVYGLPRIDLSEIYRRVEERRMAPNRLYADLPYEVVIIGIFR